MLTYPTDKKEHYANDTLKYSHVIYFLNNHFLIFPLLP